MTGFDMTFVEMKLSEFQRICETLGINIVEHDLLIKEMFWDGFCAAEVQEMIEVLDLDGEFSHLNEHPYV
tara:strand:- start:128 stop:337 length:210 start_codon:yes stop_codon:yes gene_type:complete